MAAEMPERRRLRWLLARAEVQSDICNLRFLTLSEGRCYAEGLSDGGHESALYDRWARSGARLAAVVLRRGEAHPWRWAAGHRYYAANTFAEQAWGLTSAQACKLMAEVLDG